MDSESLIFEHAPGETEVISQVELTRFLATLTAEEKLRIDLSEPNMIVINARDGRLIDKLPRARSIEVWVGGKPERADTLEYVLQLLNRL
ncbi:MAG TPA: hypothetical protein VJI73_02845 [Candidatus Paceibacterota bacterium]